MRTPSLAWRRWTQAGFFLLFLSAPALNLLRFDVRHAQLWFLGMPWSLGIDDLQRGVASPTEAGLRLLFQGVVPGVAFVIGFLWIAYRFGRLYCGWLCPHFSVVESLNRLMHRASGKFSIWERSPTEIAGVRPNAWRWLVFIPACVGMGALWAVTLLTYLLPPHVVWGGLITGELTRIPSIFLLVATTAFSLEFAFARHFFCRFGCAVGLFQSVAWMSNARAMVVSFEREQARQCKTCGEAAGVIGSACDNVCPMRLHPRNIKRHMFSCVQCGKCLQACENNGATQAQPVLLSWKSGSDAVAETVHARRNTPHGAQEWKKP